MDHRNNDQPPAVEILESFTGFSDDDGHLDDAALIAEHVLDNRCPGSWVVTGGGAGIKVSRTVAKLNEAFQVVGIGVAAIRAKPTARC
ncbi:MULTISPECIES: hypothetical protein [unclassified Ensifer]|uniref:hypothetical protein n=1 Tax=unclassified Ensifer TaxID=2633371 RepID=UPI000713640A|nr:MULTISPECIES: hypothetical protein [unclassified Ensifer]KQX03037.1 hypothetical protein ASD01_17300 [Ensifer sp. Root423]MBD9598032.1 hypothetical protein [Ensifer sp. ENS05]